MQICILEYIWEKFQKIEVIKNRLEKNKQEDYFGNEEVHLNLQEYENLKKCKDNSQYIHDLSEKSHQIDYQAGASNNKKKENDKDNQGNKNKVSKSHFLKTKILCCFKKRNSDKTSTAIIPRKQSDENNNQESPTKLKKQSEKKNFLYIPDEMRFDIKIVKCKWEDEQAVMVLLSDISQKVVIDRMRQINTYKNEMLASITHNLKTPLNAIMLLIESASLSKSIKTAQQQLSLAQNSGRLLLYMINDILDYSRLSTTKPFQLTYQHFYIEDVLLNIKSLLLNQFISKNIDFQIVLYVRDLREHLVNDKLRLEQVLLNLCQNALKFTFKGFVKIIVFEDEARPNELFFRIQDSGLGISEQVKQNLFKVYANTHVNNVNKRHGVGLGLAVCRKLVSQLGSEKVIQIESYKGEGSSFTFSIYKRHPLTQEDEISLPKFRSLKYIQMSESLQNKNEMIQNYPQKNFQMNLSKQLLSGKSLQNLRKAVQLEDNIQNEPRLDQKLNYFQGMNKNTNNIKLKDSLQLNQVGGKQNNHIILEEHEEDCKPVQFEINDQNSQLGNLDKYFMQESKIHPLSENNLLNPKASSLELKNNNQKQIEFQNQNPMQISSMELFNLAQSNSIQFQYNTQNNTNQNKKLIQPFKNNIQNNVLNNQFKTLNNEIQQSLCQNNNTQVLPSDWNTNQINVQDILNTIQTSSNQFKNPNDSNSTEFENLNQVSSEEEDNCSERIQQISIPKIPTRSYRTLTSTNVILNNSLNRFEHRKSDSYLLKSNLKKSQKKNKTQTLVQFRSNQNGLEDRNPTETELLNEDYLQQDFMTDRELFNEEYVDKDLPTDRELLNEELTKRDFQDRELLQRDFSNREQQHKDIFTIDQFENDGNIMDSYSKIDMQNNKQFQFNPLIQYKDEIINDNIGNENKKVQINNVSSYPYLSTNNIDLTKNLSLKDHLNIIQSNTNGNSNKEINASEYYKQYFQNNSTARHSQTNAEYFYDRSKQQIENLKTQSASYFRPHEIADIPKSMPQQQNPTLMDMLNSLIWRQTKLLIVDDTIFNIIALKNILKNVKNFIFDEAYNGEEALQKVKENKNYDLILMDINMPVLDGFESTTIITKLIEQHEIPPTTIIIVSAFSDEADRKKSFQSGAKAHIDKPVTLDNIYRAIKTVNLPHLQNQ